ncbi:hypothetical protein J6590_035484 [Homalodisca vitripennis]|nr:hypothetical protein J6590_035484 [Homalodisca vitripennis]
MAMTILQEDNDILQTKIKKITILTQCIRYFPPMQPSKSSLGKQISDETLVWTQVKSSQRVNITTGIPEQASLPCTNRFACLTVLDEDVQEEINMKEVQSKIMICGDSHGRDIAYHLNKKQMKNNAFGFIRPGGRTKNILNSKNIDSEKLDKIDVMVLICANDVAKNESCEALDGIKTTLTKISHTKFVLVDIPNRHDLANWSCVNLERHLHTRHGQHLNLMGKKWLAECIAEAIDNLADSEHLVDTSQPPPPGTSWDESLVDDSEKPTRKSPQQGSVVLMVKPSEINPQQGLVTLRGTTSGNIEGTASTHHP